MGITRRYFCDYDICEDMIEEILNDPERENITEIIIGYWGSDSCQEVLNMFVENSEKFQHVESLYIGDIDNEECEVSWIQQGNYEEILKSLKNLKHLKIKGSYRLDLGKDINHENLESIEIICGGLSKEVIEQLGKANLPSLKKINLYFGIEEYGFTGDIDYIYRLLESLNEKSKNLEYLGLGNSLIQDEIIEVVLDSELDNIILQKLKVLDFSNGNTSDVGAKIIIENFDKIKHLEFLNLKYNFISDEYISKLKELAIEIDLSNRNEIYSGFIGCPLITE